jgi:Mg2+/Co2+ transporter CorB
VLSGFFRDPETALTAASRSKQANAEKGDIKRKGLVTEDRERLIGSVPFLVTIVVILHIACDDDVPAPVCENGVALATLS